MVYIGRSFTAGLRIDDHSVSRRHAIFVRRGGRTKVLDDRSLNGTFVNGRRVEEAELRDGDVVVLGQWCWSIATSLRPSEAKPAAAATWARVTSAVTRGPLRAAAPMSRP